MCTRRESLQWCKNTSATFSIASCWFTSFMACLPVRLSLCRSVCLSVFSKCFISGSSCRNKRIFNKMFLKIWSDDISGTGGSRGSNGPTSGCTKSKMAAGRHLEISNVWDGSSDQHHVWFTVSIEWTTWPIPACFVICNACSQIL